MKRLRVDGQHVPVELDRSLHPKLCGECEWEPLKRGTRRRGRRTGARFRRIRINPLLGRRRRASTTLHEAIHLIAANRRIPLTERQVLELEDALVHLIRNNPTLVRDLRS